MAFLLLFTICSLFSFNPKSALLEETWFSQALKENEAKWVVTYATPQKENLESYWTGLFFQKMFQDELTQCSYLEIQSPPSQFSIALSCLAENYFSAKEELTYTLQKIRFHGFSKETLEKTKEEAKTILSPLPSTENDLLDQIELSAFSPIIDTISLEEMGEPRSQLASVSHITRASSIDFKDLPLTEQEEGLIYKIISTMAEKNPVQLAFERSSLKKKGKKIHHVHPFRFLAYVFSHTYLKSCMREIKKSHFKWNGFIDGYSKKMRNEASNDNLLPYIRGFAEFLKVDPNEVTRLVNNKDYEGLVRFLL